MARGAFDLEFRGQAFLYERVIALSLDNAGANVIPPQLYLSGNIHPGNVNIIFLASANTKNDFIRTLKIYFPKAPIIFLSVNTSSSIFTQSQYDQVLTRCINLDLQKVKMKMKITFKYISAGMDPPDSLSFSEDNISSIQRPPLGRAGEDL